MWPKIVLPKFIQGGMGVNISTWFLARIVALLGALGTVSGVAAWLVLARTLQQGDPGGHFRRALTQFPYPDIADWVLREYYIPGGKKPSAPYKKVPAITLNPSRFAIALVICANYCIVWLAKEGHDRPISINWLGKMELPRLFEVYGAMLAGVNVVTMGAGIPTWLPDILDAYARGQAAEYKITVTGCPAGVIMRFDPSEFFNQPAPMLNRPAFIPIVSSNTLASWMMKRVSPDGGGIQGFVVEGPTAGGHNAPPRDRHTLNDLGEPFYGPGDEPNYSKMPPGIPFWIGGSQTNLAKAVDLGAWGIQVGSIFACCDESGLAPQFKQEIIHRHWHGQLVVKADFLASPTGYPFQIVELPGTQSDKEIRRARKPVVCDLKGLVVSCRLPGDQYGYPCPAQPKGLYQRNGGVIEDTTSVICLCNALMATAGLGSPGERAVVTMGQNLKEFLDELTSPENDHYTAAEAMAYLMRAA